MAALPYERRYGYGIRFSLKMTHHSSRNGPSVPAHRHDLSDAFAWYSPGENVSRKYRKTISCYQGHRDDEWVRGDAIELFQWTLEDTSHI